MCHLKQIMFIDPTLYVCTQNKDKDSSLDILIDLPMERDMTLRKLEFRHKLHEYLKKQ